MDSQIDTVCCTNDMGILPEVKAHMCERIGKKIGRQKTD